jgi:hypothetical protein
MELNPEGARVGFPVAFQERKREEASVGVVPCRS